MKRIYYTLLAVLFMLSACSSLPATARPVNVVAENPRQSVYETRYCHHRKLVAMSHKEMVARWLP